MGISNLPLELCCEWLQRISRALEAVFEHLHNKVSSNRKHLSQNSMFKKEVTEEKIIYQINLPIFSSETWNRLN